MFRPYAKVLEKLCGLGMMVEDEKKHDKTMEELEDSISKNNRSID